MWVNKMKQSVETLKLQQEIVLSYVKNLQAESTNSINENVIEYLRKVYSNLNSAINKISGQNRIKEVQLELFEAGIDEEFLK
jgi:hypothetical protein